MAFMFFMSIFRQKINAIYKLVLSDYQKKYGYLTVKDSECVFYSKDRKKYIKIAKKFNNRALIISYKDIDLTDEAGLVEYNDI